MPRRKRRSRSTNALPKPKRMKKSRKEYKTDTQYIRAYYLRNKKYIDSNISQEWTEGTGRTPYEAFKFLVEATQSYTNPKTGDNYTVQEAIKRKMRSKDLHRDWEAVDVYAHNFLSKIKSTTGLKKAIIEKTSEKNVMEYSRKHKIGVDENGEPIYEEQQIRRLKDNFSAYKVFFEGYFSVMGTDALIYSYDDVYIVEYKSPKGEVGATFDVLPKAEYEAKLGIEIIRKAFRKRGGY